MLGLHLDSAIVKYPSYQGRESSILETKVILLHELPYYRIIASIEFIDRPIKNKRALVEQCDAIGHLLRTIRDVVGYNHLG